MSFGFGRTVQGQGAPLCAPKILKSRLDTSEARLHTFCFDRITIEGRVSASRFQCQSLMRLNLVSHRKKQAPDICNNEERKVSAPTNRNQALYEVRSAPTGNYLASEKRCTPLKMKSRLQRIETRLYTSCARLPCLVIWLGRNAAHRSSH